MSQPNSTKTQPTNQPYSRNEWQGSWLVGWHPPTNLCNLMANSTNEKDWTHSKKLPKSIFIGFYIIVNEPRNIFFQPCVVNYHVLHKTLMADTINMIYLFIHGVSVGVLLLMCNLSLQSIHILSVTGCQWLYWYWITIYSNTFHMVNISRLFAKIIFLY